MKVYADENWVTINDVHVLIGGNGKIVKGPAKFVGSTVADLKGQKMTESKKKELQSKYGKKSDDKGSEKTVTKRKSTREKESGGPKKSQSFGRKPKETPDDKVQNLIKNGGKEKYAYSNRELRTLAEAHQNGSPALKRQIEDKLTDINYHTEASSFKNGDYTDYDGNPLIKGVGSVNQFMNTAQVRGRRRGEQSPTKGMSDTEKNRYYNAMSQGMSESQAKSFAKSTPDSVDIGSNPATVQQNTRSMSDFYRRAGFTDIPKRARSRRR